MGKPPRVLDEWLKANAWDPIHVGDDIMDEAVENDRALSLTIEEARRLSVVEVVDAVSAYIDIKRVQVAGGWMGPMLLYVWHDAMAGALRVGCVSRSHEPATPFGSRLDTSASLDAIVAAFLRSKYLDGTPWGELRDMDPEGTPEPSAVEFVLPVFTITL